MSNKTQQALTMSGNDFKYYQDPTPGMTYRQWLVGMAMQGLLAGGGWDRYDIETLGRVAVRSADAVQAEEAK